MTAAHVSDSDFTLYVGDVRDVLATLAPRSVDCCITSPPYWGLRDYATGQWEGGDPDCDHTETTARKDGGRSGVDGFNGSRAADSDKGAVQFRGCCGKCGAIRSDRQLGLEATPEEYVANMVAVFREVRRVLADHGTCWLNLGDSYAGASTSKPELFPDAQLAQAWRTPTTSGVDTKGTHWRNPGIVGLKPKDLVGIPWRVAFALQADGWYLRSDIIWSKPNPMPESVTDRPTKAHEYVFLLSKQPRYFFDQEAVREQHSEVSLQQIAQYAREGERLERRPKGLDSSRNDVDGRLAAHGGGSRGAAMNPAGRNIRSVWEIATQPYAEAHFATYPEKLVERCLLAGCPEWVCGTCGKPRERMLEKGQSDYARMKEKGVDWSTMQEAAKDDGKGHTSNRMHVGGTRNEYGKAFSYTAAERTDLGWSNCGHNNYRPGIVLDPFMGSGTTALVARKHGRRSVGVELNPEYAELAARRLQQLSLLAVSTP